MKLGYDYLAVLVAAAEVGLGGEEAVDASCSVEAVVQKVVRNLCTYPCCGDFGDPPVESFIILFICHFEVRRKNYKIKKMKKMNKNLITSFT